MNVYMMVDAEGCSGVFDSTQVIEEQPRYAYGRQCMTNDVNTCVEACKAAGVNKIFVRDCHYRGRNLIWEELSPKADYYICGDTGNERCPALDECDCVMLVGYHAMAGSSAAILEHTMSSEYVQNYYLNGICAGELAIDAGIAGDHGKPVVFVSGDSAVCAEAQALLPWVTTAEVKKGLTIEGGLLLPPARAYELLAVKTRKAIANFSNAEIYTVEKPVRLRVETCERSKLPYHRVKPYMRIINARTFEVTGATVEEALFRSF
ncbi:hypothetical protein AGMMS49992_29220 [Clostridia bacterium]|nr:hypothetical protein AGMMS49992_29220 [Clostridia bacterium]